MSIRGLLTLVGVFMTILCVGLLADPVNLTMDDLEQVGETQSGNNQRLQAVIDLTGINDLQWAGDSYETSGLLVWDSDNGLFCWGGAEEVTHLSIKAGNRWILYELETPLLAGGFIALESEIFNKKGVAKDIAQVTGYTGGVASIADSSTSVPEPATFFMLGFGLLAIPGMKKITTSRPVRNSG